MGIKYVNLYMYKELTLEKKEKLVLNQGKLNYL